MSEITIKQGHLKPTTSKEVVIEDGDWEVSVWVHNGTVDVLVNNREDKTIRLLDKDAGTKIDLDDRTEVLLRFTSSRT